MRLILLIAVLASGTVIGQVESKLLFPKRSMQASVNALGGYSVNYAFKFFEFERRYYRTGYMRLALGQEWGTGFDALYAGALLTQFYGKGNNHLEWGLGVAVAMKYASFSPYNLLAFPAFTSGYRYQNPNKKFIWKTGIGFPEVAYASFGWGF